MEKLSNEQTKQVCFNILIEFDKICKEYGFRYWLAYGTLLGCIRHKGFIPWDDDIDVVMPRQDYQQFCSLKRWKSKDDVNHIRLVTSDNTNNYFKFFAKLNDTRTLTVEQVMRDYDGAAVGIDIFPLDGLGNNVKKARKIASRIIKLRTIINSSLYKNKRIVYQNEENPLKKVFKWAVAHTEWKSRILIKLVNHFVQRKSFDESKYVGGTHGGPKAVLRREVFDNTIQGEFEGSFFSIPEKFDEYLTEIFQNYMELPPVENRIAHATSESYRKE